METDLTRVRGIRLEHKLGEFALRQRRPGLVGDVGRQAKGPGGNPGPAPSLTLPAVSIAAASSPRITWVRGCRRASGAWPPAAKETHHDRSRQRTSSQVAWACLMRYSFLHAIGGHRNIHPVLGCVEREGTIQSRKVIKKRSSASSSGISTCSSPTPWCPWPLSTRQPG
jgi:hypothetical protein